MSERQALIGAVQEIAMGNPHLSSDQVDTLLAAATALEEAQGVPRGGPWVASGPHDMDDGGPPVWRINGEDDSYEATLCEFWSGEHDNGRMASMVARLLNEYDAAPAAPTREHEFSTKARVYSTQLHEFAAMERDRKLLAAWTPEHYSGDFPPYINLTMLRMKGDVVLTVRLPTVHGAPPGATASVRLTREMWRALVRSIPDADNVYEAADFLDSTL